MGPVPQVRNDGFTVKFPRLLEQLKISIFLAVDETLLLYTYLDKAL